MSSAFSDRLREERERLGLTQEEFAGLAGTTRRSQSNYELGERVPDAEYLMRLVDRDVDVAYLITGRRVLGDAARVDAELAQLDGVDRAALAGARIVELQNRLGLALTPEQARFLVHHVYETCPTMDVLETVVRTGLTFAGVAIGSRKAEAPAA